MRSRAFRNGWRDNLVNAAPKAIGAASGNRIESDATLTSSASDRTARASNDGHATTPSSRSRFGRQMHSPSAQSARLARSRKRPSLTTRRPPSQKQFVSLSFPFGANQCQHITRKNYGSSTTALLRYDEQMVRIFFDSSIARIGIIKAAKNFFMNFAAQDLSAHAANTSIADITSQKNFKINRPDRSRPLTGHGAY
jgi:hypothetical protein